MGFLVIGYMLCLLVSGYIMGNFWLLVTPSQNYSIESKAHITHLSGVQVVSLVQNICISEQWKICAIKYISYESSSCLLIFPCKIPTPTASRTMLHCSGI